MDTVRLTFTLIQPLYSARGADDKDLEFPPHPLRMWKALISSYHAYPGKERSDERDLLLKMEQVLPEVWVPQLSDTYSNLFFLAETEITPSGRDPLNRKKEARVRKFAVPKTQNIHFVWNIELSDAELDSLNRLASRIDYLGTSFTKVVVHARRGSPPKEKVELDRYVPMTSEDSYRRFVMRVPWKGCLDAHEKAYDSGISMLTNVRSASYVRAGKDPHSTHRLLHVLRIQSQLPLSFVGLVCKAVRQSLLSIGGRGGVTIPKLISGHEADGSVSKSSYGQLVFSPLASIGNEHASGMMTGLSIWAPKKAPKQEQDSTEKIISKWISSAGTISLDGLSSFFSESTEGLEWQWKGPYERWTTLTPIILDRWPRRQNMHHASSEVKSLILKACEWAGLPEVEDIWTSPVSIIKPQLAHKDLSQFSPMDGYRVYATITFKERVHAPVAIGKGRSFGFGLAIPDCKEA